MRKLFMTLLAATGLFAAAQASAQCPDLPPIGTPYTCYFVNGGKVVVTPGGPVPSNSTGSATVYVVGHNTNPCEAILSPEQFGSTGQGRLGTLSSSLAPGSPVSRLTGNNATLFPASLELNLNLQVTASSLNGTFTSQGPLKLRASNIRSLPLKNVDVKQVGDLKLVNEKGESIGLTNVAVTLGPPQ